MTPGTDPDRRGRMPLLVAGGVLLFALAFGAAWAAMPAPDPPAAGTTTVGLPQAPGPGPATTAEYAITPVPAASTLAALAPPPVVIRPPTVTTGNPDPPVVTQQPPPVDDPPQPVP